MDNSILKGKTVYAFGDSIVYGHTEPEKSFMRLIEEEVGIRLFMFAKNGATVVNIDSLKKEGADEETCGNYIIRQVESAPDAPPDLIVFDGYTNDAYTSPSSDSFNRDSSHIDIREHMGDPAGFDNKTFSGAFHALIHRMQEKWQGVPIVFIAVHKSGGRNYDVQKKLREAALSLCARHGVMVADIFADTELDTREPEQMRRYIIGGSGSHPNEEACRRFYMPAVTASMERALCVSLAKAEGVDLAVFAGQSNMAGRGSAALSVPCGDGGFEYKAVSAPDTLLPLREPFGAGEDRAGGLCDRNPDGSTKRSGSMVSAFVSEYSAITHRRIVAVSASMGGTGSREWKDRYIEDAASRLDDAKRFLFEKGIKVGRTFLVWSQGETDGDLKTSAEEYSENTTAVFDMLTAHGVEHIFLISTGHFNYLKYPDTNLREEAYALIRRTQEELCQKYDNITLAATFEDQLQNMSDCFHYRQQAYNEVGKTAAKAAADWAGR